MCCCREKDEKSPGELLDRIFTELSPLLGKRPALGRSSALRTMMVIPVLNTLPEPKIIIVFPLFKNSLTSDPLPAYNFSADKKGFGIF